MRPRCGLPISLLSIAVLARCEGGAELYFDGKDDYISVFPTFSMQSAWTIEAWVRLLPERATDRQCILHAATYSMSTLVGLTADAQHWTVQYGEENIIIDALAIGQSHHVAITHALVNDNTHAFIQLYINDTRVAAPTLPRVVYSEDAFAFVVGACHEIATDGIVRAHHFAGHVDELRHWGTSSPDIPGQLFLSGPPDRWGSAGQGGGLEAQYSFDRLAEAELYDSSGNNNHGRRGCVGTCFEAERPTYQRSVFDELEKGAYYYEVRQNTSLTSIADCQSSHNCLDLSLLAPGGGAVEYNALRVISVPAINAEAFITLPNSSAPLAPDALVAGMKFMVHTGQLLSSDLFEVQPCRGPASEAPLIQHCFNQPIHTVSFGILKNHAPVVGEAHDVQLFGSGGFVELPEPLPRSGTLEFRMKFLHLDGNQTIFSLSNNATSESIMYLRMDDSKVRFHFCSALVPFDLELPSFYTLEPQHFAVSWERTGISRGRAIYNVTVYRDCQPTHGDTIVVADACANFGELDSALGLPTFGQQYGAGPLGLVSGSFASISLADVRVWARPLPRAEVCARERSLLGGGEQGLRAHFPVTAADARRGDGELRNRVPGAPSARLRCALTRYPCPDMYRLAGYMLQPSVFTLPVETLEFSTTTGPVGTDRVLPPLELRTPAFDPDNVQPYRLANRSIDTLAVRIVGMPDSACGSLLANQQNVTGNATVPASELPLRFLPAQGAGAGALACQTNMTYDVVDSEGLGSDYSQTLRITVLPPGPHVTGAHLFDPGLVPGDGTGDIIMVRFGQPVRPPADAHGLFKVLDGSLGGATFDVAWNNRNDTVMMEFTSWPSDVDLVSGRTRLQFPGDDGASPRLLAAGGGTYPCADLSPPVHRGNGSYCHGGMAFNKTTARCVACGAGNRTGDDGLSCLNCPEGTFSQSDASTACQPCPPGTFSPPGNLTHRGECRQAAPGKHVPTAGATREVQCRPGRYVEAAGSDTCHFCPVGADCETPQFFRSLAVPNSHYFRTSAGQVVACRIHSACEGWSPAVNRSRCKEGMGGELCQGCAGGWWRPYTKPNSLCTKCNWYSTTSAVLVGVILLAVIWLIAVMAVDAVLWTNLHVVVVRMALNYFTAVNVLAHIEEWEFVGSLGADLAGAIAVIFKVLFSFDGSVPMPLLGLECLFGDDPTEPAGTSTGSQWRVVKVQTLFWLLVPPVLTVLIALFSIVAMEIYSVVARFTQEYIPKRRRASLESTESEFIQHYRIMGLFRSDIFRYPVPSRQWMVLKDCAPLLSVAPFFVLPAVLKQLVVPLACGSIGNGGTEWRVLASPEVVCWRGEHTGWAIVAIVGIAVYAFVLPVLVLVGITTDRVGLQGSVREKAEWGFITDGYEPRYLYWEVIVQFRRVLIILVGLWPDISTTAELAAYQFIGVAALLLHITFQPFENREGELLDRAELHGLCVFLVGVTLTQVVLLADLAHRFDFVPVLLGSSLMVVSGILICLGSRIVLTLVLACALLCLAGLAALCLSTGPDNHSARRVVGFLVLACAALINFCYIAWLLYHILEQVRVSIAQAFARSRRRIEEEENMVTPASLSDSDLMKSSVSPQGSRCWWFWWLWSKLAEFQKLQKARCVSRYKWLKDVLSKPPNASEALIYFDPRSSELILGLDPETLQGDRFISSYTKRVLARMGPFLTDKEREMIGIAFRDAIMYLIVVCDTNIVDCSILEFLVRFVFAAKKHRREMLDGKSGPNIQMRRASQESMASASMASCSSMKSAASVTSKMRACRLSVTSTSVQAVEVPALIPKLFDPSICHAGMTAKEFQSELEHIMTLGPMDIQVLLEGYHVQQGVQQRLPERLRKRLLQPLEEYSWFAAG